MQKCALLIGINEYPFIGNLKYAEQDAEAFSESLQKYYHFAPDEIVLMKPGLDMAHTPTQRMTEYQLGLLRDTRTEIDLLLIGFWGHGFTGTDGKRYLCASDTDDEDLIRTGISFDTLISTISQIGAGNTCLILDCCQNAPGRTLSSSFTESTEEELVRGAMAMSRDIKAVRQKKGFDKRQPSLAILNSCSVGERAYEWEERQHGLFTAHLLDAMSRQGKTVSDWMAYLGEHVSESARKMARRQNPYFKMEGSGVIYFPGIGPGSKPPDPPVTISIPQPVDVEKEADRIYRQLKAEQDAKSRRAEAERIARERLEREMAEVERQRQEREKAEKERLERERLEREKAEAERKRQEQLRKYEQGEKAGERRVIKIKDLEYAFRWCPPGTFMMGSPEAEEDRLDNETQHKVTLTQGFWMLETQVTQKMWKSVAGNNPSYFKGDDLPVEQVSWFECKDFILTIQRFAPGDMKFALPTEAQWEYACRAGTTTPFNFGSVLNGRQANCNGNYPYGTSNKGPYLGKTTKAGRYPANAWGLYAMHGNVWEWCEDWYADYPNGNVTDPSGPNSGSLRVQRGGSWDNSAKNCRSAFRNDFSPGYRFIYLGFRPVLSSKEIR